MPGLECRVILKVVVLFLVGMGVLAMFGKLRFPGQKQLAAARCKSCGKFNLSSGPCACGKGKG
jgi:hypothetical protein